MRGEETHGDEALGRRLSCCLDMRWILFCDRLKISTLPTPIMRNASRYSNSTGSHGYLAL